LAVDEAKEAVGTEAKVVGAGAEEVPLVDPVPVRVISKAVLDAVDERKILWRRYLYLKQQLIYLTMLTSYKSKHLAITRQSIIPMILSYTHVDAEALLYYDRRF
ncbi:hypothetical protein AMTR_s00001p00272700, partial [Amborella trichopoda]